MPGTNFHFGNAEGEIAALNEQLGTLKTYTGSDGLIINRVGRIAQIVQFPQSESTTAQSTTVSTISDSKFKPVNQIVMHTMTYDGAAYTDCNLQILVTGEVQIIPRDGGMQSGLTSKYLKCIGLTYICNGD